MAGAPIGDKQANGRGSALVTCNGHRENTRGLFTVALTDGLIGVVARPIDLILHQKDARRWG